MKKQKLNSGQWVFYKTKKAIVHEEIVKVENGFCEFMDGVKIEEKKCYKTIQKLIKNGRSSRQK